MKKFVLGYLALGLLVDVVLAMSEMAPMPLSHHVAVVLAYPVVLVWLAVIHL